MREPGIYWVRRWGSEKWSVAELRGDRWGMFGCSASIVFVPVLIVADQSSEHVGEGGLCNLAIYKPSQHLSTIPIQNLMHLLYHKNGPRLGAAEAAKGLGLPQI